MNARRRLTTETLRHGEALEFASNHSREPLCLGVSVVNQFAAPYAH